MVREVEENELNELLELYLFLHEKFLPEMTEHLRNTWRTIMQDENHHIIVKEIDGKKPSLIFIGMLDIIAQIKQRLYNGLNNLYN